MAARKATAKKKPAKRTSVKTKTTAKKKPVKKTAKKKTVEALFVASKVKENIKSFDLNVAGDALEGLNAIIYRSIEEAAHRAAANGRKTVRAHDFTV